MRKKVDARTAKLDAKINNGTAASRLGRIVLSMDADTVAIEACAEPLCMIKSKLR